MLSLDETGNFFAKHFTKEAFRLETLDYYNVESDGEDYNRYVAGEPGPDMDRKDPFLSILRAEREAGKLRHRVHVLSTPLNDYLRYECEWGYVPNIAAGEVIRILDLSALERPAGLLDEDFWLLDDTHVLRMIYDHEGRVLGAEVGADPAPYRLAREVAVATAEDFTTWWNSHPEEWRSNRNSSS